MKKVIILLFITFFSLQLQAQYGSGAAGDVTINTLNNVINTYHQVLSLSGTSLSLSVSGLPNKKYLLYQSTGSNAGNWEFVTITAGSGSSYTLGVAPTYSFGSGDIQLIEFPEYNNLTINAGASITCLPYNVTTGTGGIVFFMVKATLTINSGKIDVSGKGFPSNTGGMGAIGGVGGAGGAGGSTGAHGGVASVPNTGVAGGGNGGYKMSNAALAGSSIVPTYPGCNTAAGNAGMPLTTSVHPSLYMGACGYSGNGGNSGRGAGGGGGGAGSISCNNGTNGNAGGNGGNGGIGGAGGGVIFIYANTTSYTGTDLFLANGSNGVAATAGTAGGNGGDGGNGCGSCTAGGPGGGGTGADGGNGGNGGSGGAAGYIYIRKGGGSSLTSSLYKSFGGLGATGGAGGAGGYHGVNAPFVSSNGVTCPLIGTASGGGNTCNIVTPLDLLQTIGAGGIGTYIIQHPSSDVYIYILGTDTVTLQIQSPTSVLMTTSQAGGIHTYTLITSTVVPPPVINFLQDILNGNPTGITWNSSGTVSTASGTMLSTCGDFVRDTALNGDPGMAGLDGVDGLPTDPYEDNTPPCSDVQSYGFINYCNGFFQSSNCDATSFFAQQSDPVVSMETVDNTTTAISSNGCTYTYECRGVSMVTEARVTVDSIKPTACELNNGCVYFHGDVWTGGYGAQCLSIPNHTVDVATDIIYDNTTGRISPLLYTDANGNNVSATIGALGSGSICNLPPGDYYLVYNSYTSYGNYAQPFTISAITPPTINLTTIQPTCLNPTGTIMAAVTNGTAPYTYNWSNGSTGASINSIGGTYTVIITDSSGCKDTATSTLVAATNCCTPTSSTTALTICNNQLPYSWNGLVFNSAGTQTIHLTNAAGCDSATSLVLTVNNTTHSNTLVTACNSYTWAVDNQTYTTSGVKTHTTTNAAGCPHIDTLNLTINHSTNSTATVTLCSNDLPYNWNGYTVLNAGIVTQAGLTNIMGCDSIATLTLIIKDTCSPMVDSGCWKIVSSGSGHKVAIKNNGTLWAWGYNAYGSIGDGTNSDKHVPTQISNDTDWKTVSAGGNFTLAIKNNGTLWAWGYNAYGCLGDGTNIDKNVPTQIGTNNNWVVVSASPGHHSCAINSNGELFGWGRNDYGQLGKGNFTNYNTPQQIGTGTNWQDVSAGLLHSIALKNNGTIWACGRNNEGELGDGTTVDKNVFVQIGTNTNWAAISAGYHHNAALTNLGALYTWGWNAGGQIGDATYTDKQTPTHIGTSTDWKLISAGWYHTGAIKTNGSIWLWGADNEGALASGNNPVNYPRQTGMATNWKMLSCRGQTTAAIQTNGNLYTTGSNAYGEIGNGTSSFSNYLFVNLSCPCPVVKKDTINITNCDSIVLNSKTYYASAIVDDTLRDVNGCDSIIHTINLTINYSTNSTILINKCQNKLPFIWNGIAITNEGSTTLHFTNASGCDSAITLITTLLSNPTKTLTANVCASKLPYVYKGVNYNTAGTYTGIIGINSTDGCDTLVTLVLTVTPNPTRIVYDSVCMNKYPYVYKGVNYTHPGTFTGIIGTNLTGGCDTLITLVLTELNVTAPTHSTVYVCNNKLPYLWYGQSLNSAGSYGINLTSVKTKCDSPITVILVVMPNPTKTLAVSVCSNKLPYTYKGVNYTASGTYTGIIGINSTGGCDTLITLVLTVQTNPTRTVTANVCTNRLPYVYKGVNYSSTGTYAGIIGINSTGGCDTLITLVLTVQTNPTRTVTANVCINRLPYVYKGVNYSSAGTYAGIIGVNSTGGCDTLITLILTVTSNPTLTTSVTICNTSLPYSWQGRTLTMGGIYKDTVFKPSGCDSIYTLNLTVTNCVPCTSCDTAFKFTSNSIIKPLQGNLLEKVCGSSNFNLSCNTQYSFYINYNNPYGPSCMVKDSAVISYTTSAGNEINVAVNPNTTSVNPLRFTFVYGDNYCITHYLVVNGRVCKTCKVCFGVTCPCSCSQYNFMGNPYVKFLAGTYPTWTAKTLSASCNSSLSTNLNCGTYYRFYIPVATPSNCDVNVVAELTKVGSSAVLMSNSYTTSANALNYQFSSSGNYTVAYKMFVNGVLCRVCNMNFTVCCNPVPITSAVISGNTLACTLNKTNYLKADSAGGFWETDDSNIVKVHRTSGMVTPISNGTTPIYYNWPYKNCWYYSSINYTVKAVSTPDSTITTSNSVCVGNLLYAINNTLLDSGSTGSWSGTRITLNNVGIATATSSGTGNIKYTITNDKGCSNYIDKPITVNPLPAIPTFAYASGTRNPQTTSVGGLIQICTNRAFTLVGNPINGVWSKTGNFIVSPLGVVSTNVNVNTGSVSGGGSITYTIFNNSGCSNSRTMTANIVPCGSKGIDNRLLINTELLVIYPNPAHKAINIKIDKLMGAGIIIVTDLYGKQLKQQPLSLGTNTIDVSNFAKGMYLVSIITEQGKQTEKVVVE